MLYHTNKRKKSNSGFSLIELITVIAIMAVLMTVLTASFLRYIEKSRAAVCGQNIDNISREIQAAYISDNTKTYQNYFDEMMNNHSGETLCPSGGTYRITVTSDSYEITCSKHGGSLGNESDISKIIDIFNDTAKTGQLDSNATDVSNICNTADAKAALKKAGIDLDRLNAKTWSYTKNKGWFYWTPFDISAMTTGTKIPVMRYDSNTKTYTVWISSVDVGQTGTGEGKEYPTIGRTGIALYTDSKNDQEQSYNSALAIYQQALKEYHIEY